jgi:tetratricopeptide (TPR) repeat protein
MAQITLRDYLQETEDAISSDRSEEALSRCQHMLTYFPEALEIQRLLGEAYLAQGNLEEARHAFDWVLTSDPEHVVAYCDRALISERMADYDTALDCYQQAYELSRGNSHIRSEFNRLSAKAGQQGFMFSRAGLARLYMRGDLLSQAVQEWNAVLAVSPDRLDARIGLLETYWREGLYDRTEQLATQILEDVPTCLKALLLLAHVLSTKKAQRAQELLQQARALDPDLVMAQVLFADMFSAQTAEPFLQLLKQPPAQLEVVEKESHTPPAFANDLLRREPEPVPSSEPLHREPEPVPNRDLSTWGILETWDSKSDLKTSQFASGAVSQASSELPVWAPASILGPDDTRSKQNFPEPVPQPSAELKKSEIWQAPDKPLEQPALSDRSAFESWSQVRTPEEPTIAQEQPLNKKEPWEEAESLSRSDLTGVDLWKGEGGSNEMISLSGTWSASGSPTPPNWLSMLTQQDRLQMSGAIPSIPAFEKKDAPQTNNSISSVIEPAPAQLANSVAQVQPIKPPAPVQQVNSVAPVQPANPSTPVQPVNAVASAQPAKTPAPAPSSRDVKPSYNAGEPPAEDEEESLFGPAWLKSLGAFSIAPEMVQEPAPSSLPAEATPVSPAQELLASRTYPAEPADSAATTGAASEREQEILSTMEEIEQNLRSQGFVSLEPNSLSTIAQSDMAGKASHELAAEPEISSAEKPYQDTDLSSALAELGNLRSHMEPSSDPLAEPEVASTQEPAEEPEWMAALRSFHTPQEADLPEWSDILPPSTSAAPQEAQQAEEPYWMAPMQLEPQKVEEPEWMTALQEPQQAEEPYWMAPMQLEPQKVEEPEWMTALQGEMAPTAQEPQKSNQPEWMAALQVEPTPVAQEPRKPATPDWMATLHSGAEITSTPQETRKSQTSNDMPAISRTDETSQSVRVSDTRPNRVSTTPPAPAFEPVAQSLPGDTGHLSGSLPAPHPEPLLENELETTMRRPAVRLQHLQQSRPTAHRDLSPRGQAMERAMGKVAEGQVNYKDCLVRGYQYQLSGDYDEAMQAYRLVIKGSPELLSEVVSNVRALLKLAPKYAAGYRVLGDAYMRQGEYLQAMEAYNKALTMAKKARS